MTIAEKILAYYQQLNFDELKLPSNIRLMNPLKGAQEEKVNAIRSEFYHRFYNDNQSRKLILGINPGKNGAGFTGVPFTDTKRMEKVCGIDTGDLHSHETSSVYVYELIDRYGGPEQFYADFLIDNVFPLGFLKKTAKGRWNNFNYYDSKTMEKKCTPHVLKHFEGLRSLELSFDTVFCLGTGKNFKFLNTLNEKHQIFGEIIPLEHPRYVMQYKSKNVSDYLEKHLKLLNA